MPVPSPRNSIRIARGNYADLEENKQVFGDGEIMFAIDQDRFYTAQGGELVAVGAGIVAASSIDALNDVNTSANAPIAGQILGWDGTSWIPVTETDDSYDDTALAARVSQNEADIATNASDIDSLESSVGGLDLQAVTDAGNTTTNGATFLGNVESGVYGEQSLAETKGVRITSDGEILASSVGVASTAPRLRIKNSTQGTTTLITDGGAATFAGTVQAGGNTFGSSPSPGVILNNEGAVVVARQTSSVFIGKDTNTGNVTSEIDYSGDATFLGTVQVGPGQNTDTYHSTINPGGVYIYSPEGTTTTPVFLVKEGTNTAVEFTGNGAASFAGGNTEINSYGQFITTRTDSDTYPALTINGVGTTTGNINLYGTGNATFAGSGTFGAYCIAADFDSNHPSDGRFGRLNWSGARWTDTLGNNVIQFDADGGGSATFKSTLTVDNDTAVNAWAIKAINNDARSGRATIRAQNEAGGELFAGVNADSSEQVFTVQSTGSASFAGNVDSDGYTGPYASLQVPIGETEANYGVYTVRNIAGTPTAQIFGTGSAKFTDNSSIFAGVNGGSAVFYGGDSSTTSQSNAKFRLNSSGSASFDGDITLGDYATNGSTTGIKLNPDNNGNGALVVQGGGTSDMAIGVYDGAAKKYKASVSHDGTAYFAGTVEVGDSTPWSSPTKTGTYMAAGGSIETYRDVNGSTNGAYSAYYKNPNGNNDKVFSVNMDGSAIFAGGLTQILSSGNQQWGGNGYDGTQGSYVSKGGTFYATPASGTEAFLAFNEGSSTPTATITGAGAASFKNITDGAYTYIANKPGTDALCLSGGASGDPNTTWWQILPNGDFNSLGSATFAGTVSAQGSVLTSDQRFKENITDARSQLADVTALGSSLKNWNWNDEAPVADKETRFLGLIAQEAETICPSLVTEMGEGEGSYKAIKSDVLVMKLLGAVAELSQQNADMKARLDALEGN